MACLRVNRLPQLLKLLVEDIVEGENIWYNNKQVFNTGWAYSADRHTVWTEAPRNTDLAHTPKKILCLPQLKTTPTGITYHSVVGMHNKRKQQTGALDSFPPWGACASGEVSGRNQWPGRAAVLVPLTTAKERR